jgi:hypothetical protein
MLEVRRVLYDDLPQRPQIVPGRLHGTRHAWMARYAPLLSQDEFTKFVTLMRNLSPFVRLIILLQRADTGAVELTQQRQPQPDPAAAAAVFVKPYALLQLEH